MQVMLLACDAEDDTSQRHPGFLAVPGEVGDSVGRIERLEHRRLPLEDVEQPYQSDGQKPHQHHRPKHERHLHAQRTHTKSGSLLATN